MKIDQTMKRPTLEGTFVQDSLVANWNDDMWQKELAIMKEAGLKYLIISVVNESQSGTYNVTYSTKIDCLKKYYNGKDLIEMCLRNCEKQGIKVFIGLNGSDKWWVLYTAFQDWLLSQMELGNKIARDCYQLYKQKYPDTFYGWYWVWELFNMPLFSHQFNHRAEHIDLITKAININLRCITEIDPSMPLMLSPFANDKLSTADEHEEFWCDFLSKAEFRKGDILCPQDAVGAGWTSLENLDNWFSRYKKALSQNSAVSLWANNENFDQHDWSSSTIDRLIKQMEITSNYAEHHISFSYNHYYSPLNINEGFHKAYCDYLKTGEQIGLKPGAPIHLKIIKIPNFTNYISWDNTDPQNVAGFRIYQDGNLIGSNKSVRNDGKGFIPVLETTYVDQYMVNNSAVYEIESFNFFGLNSDRILAKS
jgi:hypothetical protein